MGVVYFVVGIGIIVGGLWLVSQIGGGGRSKGQARLTPDDQRVCDLCGKGHKWLDHVKYYKRKYGWFEGYAHGECLDRANRERR